MKPLVIDYLRTHTFQQLEDEHGVCVRFANDGRKASLNYDQILTKSGDKLAGECRGMVIACDGFDAADPSWKDKIVGDVQLLAWPFERFYNLGDPTCADVDWDDPELKVYEKLDGTMIVFYWDPHDSRWHAGTRSVPEADLPIRVDDMQIGNTTFSGLFWSTLESVYNESLADDENYAFESWIYDEFCNDCTYVFELTTQHNRVVVKYDKPNVTLLGVRSLQTGAEIALEKVWLPTRIQRPRVWDLGSPAAVEAFVNSADPAQFEGVVVCDSQFRRVKVKNKAWVLSSKAKDLVTVSRRSALLAIINGEIDDVIPLVEQSIADDLLRMQSSLLAYLRSIDERFASFKEQAGADRKTFASFVLASGDWTPAYFNMWEGRSKSALEWTRSAASAGKLSHGSLDLLLKKIS